MRSEPDDADSFSFDGAEIMGCTGCQKDWKKAKNITLKIIKKQQKHKGRGTVPTVTKTVSKDFFFRFVAPPEAPERGDLDDEAEAVRAADFEIGRFLRERAMPSSGLCFPGEAIEDDDDDYDEEGGEADEEGEEEGNEENDPDYDPKKDRDPAEREQPGGRTRGLEDSLRWSTCCFPGKDEFYNIRQAYSSFLLFACFCLCSLK